MSSQSSSLVHARVCDVETSVSSAGRGLSLALTGENCAREPQGSPQHRGCKGSSIFITGYLSIASAGMVFELQLSGRSTIGKVAVSS